MLRGDAYRFRLPKALGHEQHGDRYAVVVQADECLPRSVVIVAPTSRSARSASFRPEAEIAGNTTRVLVEQIGAVDTRRLGELAVARQHDGTTSPPAAWDRVRVSLSFGQAMMPG